MSEPFQIRVPQMGEGLQGALVVRVLKNIGEWVEEDSDVVEVETEKAVLSISTPVSGFVSGISCRPGETMGIGAVLLEIGQNQPCLSGGQSAALPQLRKGESRAAAIPPVRQAEIRLCEKQARLAEYMHLSKDIVIPASIESRLAWDDIDAIKRIFRNSPEMAGVPGGLDIICWATAQAMRQFWKFRQRMTRENEISISEECLIGIAVSGEGDALHMPVAAIRAGEGLLAVRTRVQAALIREEDGAGGYHSLALSDMSAFQVIRAQPVIVYPAVGTLFVGAPHWAMTGASASARVSNLVLTFDHRLINGVYAAEFLRQIGRNIRELASHLSAQPRQQRNDATPRTPKVEHQGG